MTGDASPVDPSAAAPDALAHEPDSAAGRIPVVAGIDAGGSKTRVIVADAAGAPAVTVMAAGVAMRPGDEEQCAAALAGALGAALAATGGAGAMVQVLVVGIAGVGREPERVALQGALERSGIAHDVIVETDAAVALADAFGERAGVLLIAGTGSIAYGRGPAGALARAGGWGPVIGDEGSGTWIARRALSAVSAAADGREPDSALVGAILTAAQANAPEDLIPWAAAAGRDTLAALAPAVFAAAEHGDGRASAIVDMAAEELLLHVRALARRLFGDERAELEVALAGGVLGRGSLLRRRVERRLKIAVPGARVRPGEVDGARGAVALAVRLLRAGR